MTIADKLSKNEPLDAQETQRLDMALRNLDILGSWIGSDGNPSFKNMYAEQGTFALLPNGGGYFYSSAPQSIPDSEDTPIELTEVRPPSSDQIVRLDPDDNTKLTWASYAQHNFIIVMAIAWFDTNATGRRAIAMDVFNTADDSWAATHWLMDVSARTDGAYTNVFGFAPTGLGEDQYIKMGAYQESGGNLNLMYFRVALFAAR